MTNITLSFNPKKVAQYEINWWMAHHQKDKPALVENLLKQHIELFDLPQDKAKVAVSFFFDAVKMHDVRNWEEAKKFATKYYQIICEHLSLAADPNKLGEAEINWWIKHDELEFDNDKNELTQAFAILYSELFSIPENIMMNIAKHKTMATYEHDLAEIDGITSDESEVHWQNAQNLLEKFYSLIIIRIC